MAAWIPFQPISLSCRLPFENSIRLMASVLDGTYGFNEEISVVVVGCKTSTACGGPLLCTYFLGLPLALV